MLGEAVNVVTDYLSLLVLTLPIAIIGRNFHLQYESFFRCVPNTPKSARWPPVPVYVCILNLPFLCEPNNSITRPTAPPPTHRNWDNEDYWSSSSDSDDEGEADALDDYDTAMAKLKNDQVNSRLGLNGPGPGTPLHALAEEGKVAAEDAVRRAPKPLKL